MPDLPDPVQMAANFAKEMTNIAKTAVFTGHFQVPQDISDARFNICKTCEFLIQDRARCSKCGCFMELKVKLVSAKCPVSKW